MATADAEAQLFVQTAKVLKSTSIRGKESIDLVTQTYTAVVSSRSQTHGRAEFIKLIYGILSEPQQGPPRLRIMCARLLQELSPSNALSITSFDPPVDRRQLPFVLPLLLATKKRKTIRTLLPQIVKLAVGAEQDVRVAALCALAALTQNYGRIPVPLEGLDIQMREWMRNASTVSATSSSGLSFWKRPTTSVPCTELDGSPLREFFTVLNCSVAYTLDQALNVYSFSFLFSWIQQTYLQESDSKPLDNDLKEVIIKYCLRLFEQADMLWTPVNDYRIRQQGVTHSLLGGGPVNWTDIDIMAVEEAVVEAIRILDLICQIDSSLVSRLFPVIKRLYNRNSSLAAPHGHVFLALTQFFLIHSPTVVYDPDPVYSALFHDYIGSHYSDPVFAFECMQFCIRFKDYLRQSHLFERYFPTILKLVAWHPQSLAEDFCSLINILMENDTYIELLHGFLDLPLLTAAMDHHLKNKDLLTLSPDLPPELLVAASANRALFNYILRSEAGLGNFNFWSQTTWPLLLDFYNDQSPPSARVLASSSVVPVLLSHYQRCLLATATEKQLETIVPVIFERVTQIYPIGVFQESVRQSLVAILLAIMDVHPHFVVSLRKFILDFVANRREVGREELLLHVCWLIGKYATPVVDPRLTSDVIYEFYETLELFAYETNMAMTSGASGLFSPNASSLSPASTTAAAMIYDGKQTRAREDTSSEVILSSRMLSTLMASLAKLAARSPDLIPRALLCISKITKSHQRFLQSRHLHDLSVLQRANELSRLLRYPSVAAAILDPPVVTPGQHSDDSHVDRNSSLPFLLQPAMADVANQELFTDGVPAQLWPPLHPFML